MVKSPEPRRRGSLRVLALLLAVLMIPFGMVSAASSAAAVTPYLAGSSTLNGNWETVQLSHSGVLSGIGIQSGSGGAWSCVFSVAYPSAGTMQWTSGTCDGAVDITPGYLQIPEPGTRYELAFNGYADTSDGSGGFQVCDQLVSGTLQEHPDDGWSVFSTLPGGTVDLGDPTCEVQQLCLVMIETGLADGEYMACVDLELQAPESTLGQCSEGTITHVVVEEYFTGSGNPYTQVWFYGTGLLGSWGALGIRGTTPGTMKSVGASPDGTEVYVNNFTGHGYTGFQVFENDLDSWYDDNAAGVGELPPTGWMGTTQPQHCVFYFGPKIASVVDSDIDDPAGPLNGEAPGELEPPPDLTPEDNNPADESSFWGEILALLAATVAAILGIPGLILGGLLGVIADAFVPADGYMDAKAGALRAKWENTAPFKWWNSFAGLSIGPGASGCGGIAFDPPIPGAESVEPAYIGAACSGKMAELAGMVRLALSAAVVIYGGWACVRVLLGGFGVRPEFNPDGSVMEKARD